MPFKNILNDMYSRDISKKVLAGITTRSRQGKFCGGTPPFGLMRDPEDKGFKLYSLIYARALASLMAPSRFDATSVVLENNNYYFNASGSCIIYIKYIHLTYTYFNLRDFNSISFIPRQNKTVEY